jgi:hypothetical protein
MSTGKPSRPGVDRLPEKPVFVCLLSDFQRKKWQMAQLDGLSAPGWVSPLWILYL